MNLEEIITPDLIKIFGIVTYSLFLITLAGGLFRKKLAPIMGRAFLKTHMILGITAIVLATVHAALVFMFY